MRLREAENEDTIKKLRSRLDEVEEEARRTRERVPEAAVAGLQVRWGKYVEVGGETLKRVGRPQGTETKFQVILRRTTVPSDAQRYPPTHNGTLKSFI